MQNNEYRPILEAEEYPPQETTQDGVGVNEKVQEPVTDAARKERAAELSQIELTSKRTMLLDRLKAAHETARTIPELESELREVLGSMGYDLVARSPFVEPECFRFHSRPAKGEK